MHVASGDRSAATENGLLDSRPERTTRRLFDPYELLFVDDGWYAFGYCHRSAEIRMFAVQRVRSVRETGETFDRPADFRAADL